MGCMQAKRSRVHSVRGRGGWRRWGSHLVPPKAQVLFWQVCCGLAFCHSNNIAHRNIKPEATPCARTPPRAVSPIRALLAGEGCRRRGATPEAKSQSVRNRTRGVLIPAASLSFSHGAPAASPPSPQARGRFRPQAKPHGRPSPLRGPCSACVPYDSTRGREARALHGARGDHTGHLPAKGGAHADEVAEQTSA